MGYHPDDFTDVFGRYLPSPPLLAGTPEHRGNEAVDDPEHEDTEEGYVPSAPAHHDANVPEFRINEGEEGENTLRQCPQTREPCPGWCQEHERCWALVGEPDEVSP